MNRPSTISTGAKKPMGLRAQDSNCCNSGHSNCAPHQTSPQPAKQRYSRGWRWQMRRDWRTPNAPNVQRPPLTSNLQCHSRGRNPVLLERLPSYQRPSYALAQISSWIPARVYPRTRRSRDPGAGMTGWSSVCQRFGNVWAAFGVRVETSPRTGYPDALTTHARMRLWLGSDVFSFPARRCM